MKNLLLLLCICSCISCGENHEDINVVKANIDGHTEKYIIVNIDSCEYITTNAWAGAIIVHKANCHNPVHKIK